MFHSRPTLALSGLIALGLSASPSFVQGATYQILIEDLVAGGPATGQPITPPVAVVHGPGYSLFAPGSPASPGLEIVAEEGTPTVLVGEAEGSADVSFVTVGAAGPFFDAAMFEVEGDAGDLLSIVAMLARSNDLITGIHDVPLPAGGSMMIMTNAYDAGTELNTGLVEHIPFYGNPGGPDEDGVVSVMMMYSVLDDPIEGQIDYTFPPAARITITRMDPTPLEDASWTDVKRLF
jgi:hypothetical protein